ncbi:MAG: hypothetical protein GY796_33810 [Chloroflexi bacterium]|nr:hypothetical protein [Chloroflexota bacterium]
MLRKSRKGQSLVEFAFILPILLLVILGIIEAAWIVWAYISVQNVARETARYAVTGAPLNDQGEPWTLAAVLDEDDTNNPNPLDEDTRVYHIVEFAKDASRSTGLPIREWPGDVGFTDYYDEARDPTDRTHAQKFGVFIEGFVTADDTDWTPYHPGSKGLNVHVQVYYNVEMLDPIYDALLAGRTLHMTGDVVLQNEGLNLALEGEPPPFAPPGGQASSSFGSQTGAPALTVQLGGAPAVDIPAGSSVNLLLEKHVDGTPYYVCFDGTSINTPSAGPFTPGPSGSLLVSNHIVPLGTAGSATFTTSLNSDCSSTVATAAVNILSSSTPFIGVGFAGHALYTWPDNSIVRVFVAGHEPGTTYDILMAGVPMRAGDGSGDVCQVTTGANSFGESDWAECAITNDIAAGDHLVTTGFATNTVTVEPATITVDGGNEWVDNTAIKIILRNHAPLRTYWVYFGTTLVGSFLTNGDGVAIVEYFIPINTEGSFKIRSQDDIVIAEPPSTIREIAVSDNIIVTIPTEPLLLVDGRKTSPTNRLDRPAGSVMSLDLRVHSRDTDYDVTFATDTSDTTGDLAGTVRTDDVNGNYLQLSYKIPADTPLGNRMFISYLTGQTTVYSATAYINVVENSIIEITGGSDHFPGETIELTLKGHLPNTSYDVYIDLNGDGIITADEKVADSIFTDDNGESTFNYTLPRAALLGDLSLTRKIISRIEDDPTPTDDSSFSTYVATVDLNLIEADLEVVDITFPPDPQPGADLEIGLHIKNNTNESLNSFPFDNDLYINPLSAPTLTQVLPPGEQKIWINQIGPQQTIVITPVVNLSNEGTYSVYGRTDTSNRIAELTDDNNIRNESLVLQCNLTPFADNFDNGSQTPWQLNFFGNAGGGNATTWDNPWIGYYWNPSPPSELFAMHSTIDPAALKLVQPPALPVLQATSQPVVIAAEEAYASVNIDNVHSQIAAEEAGVSGNSYQVQSASFASNPAAIPNRQTTTIDVRVGQNRDDAEEDVNDGDMHRGSSDLEMVNDDGTDQKIGIRFLNVTIPSNATILNAYLEFKAKDDTSGSTSLTIWGEKSTNSARFSNSDNDITDRTSTSDSVSWSNIPDWSNNTVHQSPSLVPVVQEIIDQTGWDSGNDSMTFIITGSGRRRAYSYNGSNNDAPRLVIEYTTAVVDTPTPIPTSTPTSTPTNTPLPPTDTPTPLPSGCSIPSGYSTSVTWGSSADIGGATPGLTAQSGADKVYVCGSGTSIWGTGDSFRYVYTTQAGDIEFKARVSNWSPNSEQEWSKGGLMLRSTNTNDAAFAHVVLNKTPQIRAQARPSDGGNTVDTQPENGGDASVPVWLALRKVGSTVTAYRSSVASPGDILASGDWTQVGTFSSINLGGGNYLVGFAISAYDNNEVAQATFENISIVAVGPPPTDTPTPTPTTIPSTCGLSNNYFIELGGQVVMEAENYNSAVAGTGNASSKSWLPVNYNGTDTMQAQTDSGVNTQLNTNGPGLRYQIEFQTAGNYYVYVRGRSPGDSDTSDSVHVGLDGVAVTTSGGTGLTGFNDNISWQNSHNGTNTFITVPNSGLYTFDMWMREDGIMADKIWLSTTQNQVNNGNTSTNPVESVCSLPAPAPTPTSTPTETPLPTATSTPVPPSSFAPPSNLVVSVGMAGSGDPVMNLTWTDNSGDEGTGPEETSFIIERLDGVTWVEIATTEVDGASYTDTGVTCGEINYRYRVRGFLAPDTISAAVEANNTTPACPADECDTNGELDGELRLCSAGSSMTQSNDASGGYLFMNQAVFSFTFDIRVRVMAVSDQNSQSMAGLEVRESLVNNAKKLQVVVRNQNRDVRVFTRGSSSPTSDWVSTNAITDTNGDTPVWLRIVRANQKFYFYYNSFDDEAPVIGAWTPLGSTDDTMGSAVRIGLTNASATGARGMSRWSNFNLSCPLELVGASATCGAVTEDTGVAVINAVNYIDNFPSNTSPIRQWQHKTSQDQYAAMYFNGSTPVFDNTNYPSAPLLEYAVNIEQSDEYFLWIFGYSPDNSGDTVQVGFDGARLDFGTMEDKAGSGVRWFNTDTTGRSVKQFLSQGVHTINIWGAEDDFELIQILLTSYPDLVPSGLQPQSACLSPVPPEFPSNLRQCTDVLQNVGFEKNDGAGYALNWTTGDLSHQAIYGPTAYEGSFGLGLRSVLFGVLRNDPFTYQDFTMPTWLNNDTSTARISLRKAVDRGTDADELRFVLRDENGTDLTTPIKLADGDDFPDVIGGIPLAADFTQFPSGAEDNDAFNHLTGNVQIEQLVGETVQAYVYMPNSSSDSNYPASTDFFIDKVEVQVCTSQPQPALEAGKGAVTGQLFILTDEGKQIAVEGAPVWIFGLTPPGPMQTTYSINNPTGRYSFQNLNPGLYNLYSEFVDSSGAPFGVTVPVNIAAGQTATQNLILPYGNVGGGSSISD